MPGLIAEGNSDEPYLGKLIKRQLDVLLLAKSPRSVAVADCEIAPVHTTGSGGVTAVIEAAWDLAQDCDLLFVHCDEDERDKAGKIAEELAQRRRAVRRAALPVPLIPVLMTESWMLADRKALESVVPGVELADYPYAKPAAVEKKVALPSDKKTKVGPKQVWKALLGPDAHETLTDAAELLVRRTDLGVLAQVPSYREWLKGTEAALGGLGYL
ncbi:hypothetical protein [Streptomyces palmae]|uniref:DUF4276 family protein n=1 Tax=Streptomyces palmae TaxID=1701085 RepID=A0A4Z0GJ33_9ACTN|nr:hypothetical protein [Streptomyces palmae]TGA95290.1 hypothetical protein E4099_25655 [Streptomyces palmae]